MENKNQNSKPDEYREKSDKQKIEDQKKKTIVLPNAKANGPPFPLREEASCSPSAIWEITDFVS